MESSFKGTSRRYISAIELEIWQIKRVEAGIKAADDQLFAKDVEVAQAFKRCREL